MNRGTELHRAGDLELANEYYLQSVTTLEELANEKPELIEHHICLGEVHHRLGLVRRKLKRYDLALADFQQAIEDQLVAFHSSPKKDPYRHLLRRHFQGLSLVCASFTRPDAAVLTSVENRAVWPDDPEELYFVACTLADCEPLLADRSDAP